jgi:hypothetical protein
LEGPYSITVIRCFAALSHSDPQNAVRVTLMCASAQNLRLSPTDAKRAKESKSKSIDIGYLATRRRIGEFSAS